MKSNEIEKHSEAMVRLLQLRGIRDPLVLQAMGGVPRHLFVEEKHRTSAYEDHPLPIGHRQTISQPFIVAMMTEALGLKPGDRALDVGTGSGYQAAVLAEMGMEVYTVERVPELYTAARELLDGLGYDVHFRLGDGYAGWPEHAPYDGIVVAATIPEVPPPLWEQLAEGGTMVIPLGHPYGRQVLWRIVKEDGEARRYDMGDVAFVPFITE